MATPQTRCAELDPFAPSFDGGLAAVEIEVNQIVEAETRELPAYSFDSDDKTLAGIGDSNSADSSAVRHFDSSDRTLVGIGPAERAKLAELANQLRQAEAQQAEAQQTEAQQTEAQQTEAQQTEAQQAEATPESVATPHSEPPGPFVASDDEAPPRLPTQPGEPWVFALSAVLVAAAAVALLRGDVARSTAPRRYFATTVTAPPPTANEARMSDVQLETAAATSAESCAVETSVSPPSAPPVTRAPEEARQLAVPAAPAQREKQLEFAPRLATTKSTATQLLGALDVTSNPPSGLVIDGRPQGKAPRVIQLPSGPHTVLFVHPEGGRMSVTVNVRAGRTTTASADF